MGGGWGVREQSYFLQKFQEFIFAIESSITKFRGIYFHDRPINGSFRGIYLRDLGAKSRK